MRGPRVWAPGATVGPACSARHGPPSSGMPGRRHGSRSPPPMPTDRSKSTTSTGWPRPRCCPDATTRATAPGCGATAHGSPLGDAAHALRCLFWLTFRLLNSGRIEQANGWIARAGTLLDEIGPDGVEGGQLAYLTGLRAVFEGDEPGAVEGFEESAAAGARHNDIDLQVLGQTGLSRMLIRLDRQADGLHLLDEVMVALAESEVVPIVVGDVYCSAIEACSETLDVRRAREWTAALSRWCEEQPDLVPYRGQCLVHRSELLQLGGDWPAAMDQAEQARDRLSRPTLQLALGAACYQQGELHRLRGDFAKADDAYALASRHGRDPQPGLALLRLAQGRPDSAAAMSHRLVGESEAWPERSRILPAHAEIMLATGDVAAGRAAADELARGTSETSGPMLRATTALVLGRVLVAEGHDRDGAATITRGAAALDRSRRPVRGSAHPGAHRPGLRRPRRRRLGWARDRRRPTGVHPAGSRCGPS